MNRIDIEDCTFMIAAHDSPEIEIRAAGQYIPASRGARERSGLQIEPDEAAGFEVASVEFRFVRYDVKKLRHVPVTEWVEFPAALLMPAHMDAIAEQCRARCENEILLEREDAAEARRAA